MLDNLWFWVALVAIVLVIFFFWRRKKSSSESETFRDLLTDVEDDVKKETTTLHDIYAKKDEEFKEFMNSPDEDENKKVFTSHATNRDVVKTAGIRYDYTKDEDENPSSIPADVTPKPAAIAASGSFEYAPMVVTGEVSNIVPMKREETATSATFPEDDAAPVTLTDDDMTAAEDIMKAEDDRVISQIITVADPIPAPAVKNQRAFTDQEVHDIRSRAANGISREEIADIASKKGVSVRTVERLISYDTYANVR